MIVKTLRLKSKGCFKRLIDYIMTDEKNELRNKGFLLTHNLMHDDKEGIIKEFKDNDSYRKNKRKNSVLLNHEILSFHAKDKDVLNQEKLEDIAEEYIKIRGADKALVIAVPHFEKDHWHIHFAISSTELHSPKKLLRMDNKTFAKVRRNIECYHLQKYPEIKHSTVYLDKKIKQNLNKKEQDQNVRKERAFHSKKRKEGKGQKMDKDRLKKAIKEMYDMSKSVDSFLNLINAQNELKYYMYRDKLAGVKYQTKGGKERKYRFTTLGISKEMLRDLEQGKKKEAPSLLGSILNDKELDRYLKKNQAEEQEKMLNKYIQEANEITNELSDKEQRKKIKRLLENVLQKSRTMPQFLYFVSRIGLGKNIVEDKFKGIVHNGKEYNFKEIGLINMIQEKQAAFDKQKQNRADKKIKEEKDRIGKSIETDLYMSGFFF